MKAMPEDLSARSDFALLRELRGRGYTVNAGFYAERLVADALGGQLAPKSQKSWDVLANGEKLQVKCRTVSSPMYVFGNRVAGSGLDRAYLGKRESDHRTSE